MSTTENPSDDKAWKAHLADLRAAVAGPVLLQGEDGYDAERVGFDLSGQQWPGLVLGATEPADILAGVRFAGDWNLPVGVQATGHGPTVACDGGLLINTSRATGVTIDATARTAWLQAGVIWHDVVQAAAPYGLAPLCGAAPAVGAISYLLGGGLGPLGRPCGFAADHVRSIDIVTADGEARRVTPEAEPELFWAVRGGGGNFGVVTAMEIDLMPVADLYGGGLFFSGDDAQAVLEAFRASTALAPDELVLSVALLRFPDLPVLPPPLRDRFCCHVRVAYYGEGQQGERLIAPIRDAAPVLLDGLGDMPFTDIGTIHNDPTTPLPVESRSLVLRSVDAGTLSTVVRHAGPATGFLIELRHLGGALSRQPEIPNSVGHRSGAFSVFTTAYQSPGGITALGLAQQRLIDDLRPWSNGGALLNFLAGPYVTPTDVRNAYREADFARLVAIKAEWDPSNMFRFNHNIPAAAEASP